MSHGVRLVFQPVGALAGGALVVACVAAYLAGGGQCSGGEVPGAYGSFVCYAPEAFVFLTPAVAAVVGGVLVAGSRARGEDVVYAVRGLSAWRLAVARLLAGSGAAAVVVLAAGLVLVGLALIFLPHRPELAIPPGVTITPGSTLPEAGVPVPGLWREAPLVGDLVAVVVYAWAAAALAALGNAAGQLVAQPLVAFAAPVFLVLVTQVAPLPGAWQWVSGFPYLDLMPISGTMTELPGGWRLPALLGYWGVVLSAGVAVTMLAARRQEALA